MILSYTDLKKAWKTGKIRFRPDISEEQIGLSSIDLRLGHIFTRLKEKPGLVVRPASEGFDPPDIVEHENFEKKTILGEHPTFRLKPAQLRLALTEEEIGVPEAILPNLWSLLATETLAK